MRLLAWDPNPISLGFCLCELKVLILTVLKFKIKKLKKNTHWWTFQDGGLEK